MASSLLCFFASRHMNCSSISVVCAWNARDDLRSLNVCVASVGSWVRSSRHPGPQCLEASQLRTCHDSLDNARVVQFYLGRWHGCERPLLQVRHSSRWHLPAMFSISDSNNTQRGRCSHQDSVPPAPTSRPRAAHHARPALVWRRNVAQAARLCLYTVAHAPQRLYRNCQEKNSGTSLIRILPVGVSEL